jgi:hypothetical protein
MKLYHLKVLLESDEIVFRDLLANENHNLEEFHQAILQSFGFKGKEMASFIKTDDNWEAVAEYTLEAISEESKAQLMQNALISEVFKKEGDTLDYIYDYLNEWKFNLELLKIEEADAIDQIKEVGSHGKAPNENERSLTGKDAESILMNAILGDEFEEDEEDDLFDEGFESLDDYEEYL